MTLHTILGAGGAIANSLLDDAPEQGLAVNSRPWLRQSDAHRLLEGRQTTGKVVLLP